MKLVSWYLEGIDFQDAPRSLEELAERAQRNEVDRSDLTSTAKWEHLLKGDRADLPDGWTYLERLASTRRGIATGANSFFLLSRDMVRTAGIREEMLLPCVGRANDVEGLIFGPEDFEAFASEGGRAYLLNFHGSLNETERAYVAEGERLGLPKRYLLAYRRPWYSMEQRAVAAVWAAVFNRGDLRFVFNGAGVRSLTNFHCLYPVADDADFAKALTFCLNSKTVRQHSRLHTRLYGGGLSKFEPNDLKLIPVPDLMRMSRSTILKLSGALDHADAHERQSIDYYSTCEAERLIQDASNEARSGGGSLI